MNYDYLDQVIREVKDNNFDKYDVLSTGQRLYVILSSNRFDLLEEEGTTIAQALKFLETSAIDEIWKRHA
ncbi:hypothetical protein A6E01_20385 (plasmid) [Vibrio breoganii]|uniref:Uncharacterized protein n=2 Tax=Vibrio breoganii TaxID=553239 RepID=A0AAN0XZW7_9VIBR|nr:hypothetical protein A6E01_20385 [Vibrio breoganii]PML15835.1 hypothetical protein BCT84_07480 [Vibrio breoganii]